MSGEKPYTCEICKKAFADCSNLTKHKKIHKHNSAVETNELSDGTSMGSVWQILPTSQEENANITNNVSQVMANNETEVSGDGMSQIIYVTYDDPGNSNDSNLHYSKYILIHVL